MFVTAEGYCMPEGGSSGGIVRVPWQPGQFPLGSMAQVGSARSMTLRLLGMFGWYRRSLGEIGGADAVKLLTAASTIRVFTFVVPLCSSKPTNDRFDILANGQMN